MPRDAVSRTANVGTVGKNGLNLSSLSEILSSLAIMGAQLSAPLKLFDTMLLLCTGSFRGPSIATRDAERRQS